MQRIELNRASGVPVFRQVIDQVVFMIEAGELRDGDRLPSSRLLAANLDVNRNTTARAYAELGRLGYLASQGRGGMVVKRPDRAREHLAAHEAAVAALAGPIRECLELGLSADEIAMIAYHQSLHAQQSSIRVAFVECNEERAKSFATDLSETVGSDVLGLVLSDIEEADVADCDLVVTTFFHHAELRRQIHAMALSRPPEILAIVAAPHIKTLTRLAAIPKNKRIGILYSTDDQAEAIRQSLSDTGLKNVKVLHGPNDAEFKNCDVVVVPSEDPALAAKAAEKARDGSKVIEFGNVLDSASLRMVAEIVDEIRERKDRMLLDHDRATRE
ncbi:GntR family transcriptional regulator [Sphaerisporangium sp. NPDC051011]|uniref:GntR family transcriptional regulator n=1 Tax=Sphaerisporangium sp. NPDC051011 TaxID=3155792 RepID=UPI0033C6C628